MEQLTAHAWIDLPLAAGFPVDLKIFQPLPFEIYTVLWGMSKVEEKVFK